MNTPSAGEMLVLALLIAMSVLLFWRRFGRVLRIIRASKPAPGFEIRPVSRRVLDFIGEVMLQAKVIRERPMAGIAHAWVFWGFCVFALVTLDHIASGFGFDLVSRESGFGRLYFAWAAAFAVAVSVGIAGLAVRRFIVRPKWLGELSGESGIIAALIFFLMITYLAEWWAHEDSAFQRANWWAHTLALLVFLPLIPHTKHLHLVLSPFTIFLRRGSFSRIPPLEGDEDFGLFTGKDFTRIDSLQAFSCVECGRCTEHCPANNTGKILNPKQVVLGLRSYLRGPGTAGEEPVLDNHVSMEAVFQCTSCGACEYQCPVGVEHLPMIVGLRRGAVNTGRWEDEHGTKFFLNLERNGNALGMSASERDKFIQKAGLPLFDGSQEFCLWLGCMGAYDPRGREIVQSLVKVLEHLDITYGVLKREKCSGDPARRLGNDLLFGELAEFNLEQMREHGVKRLVSICPHCVETIQQDWKEYGASFPIEHHSELLFRNRSRLPSNGGSRQIVFHDPCYLGRYRDIYEEPRSIARLGGHVIDPPRSRHRSFCCGAGGGLAFLGEEKGKRVNVERAEELVATKADVIGAACPFCNTMFRDALSSMEASPQLLDIAQIAAASIEK